MVLVLTAVGFVVLIALPRAGGTVIVVFAMRHVRQHNQQQQTQQQRISNVNANASHRVAAHHVSVSPIPLHLILFFLSYVRLQNVRQPVAIQRALRKDRETLREEKSIANFEDNEEVWYLDIDLLSEANTNEQCLH